MISVLLPEHGTAHTLFGRRDFSYCEECAAKLPTCCCTLLGPTTSTRCDNCGTTETKEHSNACQELIA